MIIIGGGIIGLSLAIALRKRGATVLVVERGEPGREASYAAGGMLVDCPLETPSVLQALATASARLYPEFAHELELEAGMKVDLRTSATRAQSCSPRRSTPSEMLHLSPNTRFPASFKNWSQHLFSLAIRLCT